MAAPASPTIQIYRTLTPGRLPSLAEGELGLDMASSPAKLYVGVPSNINAAGLIQLLPPLNGGGGGIGTITGVLAGTGLAGGGTSGTITLSLGSSVILTGIPTATTASVGTATTQIATTQFVMNALAGIGGGTITGITAGTGLTGGGTSGNVSLALGTNLNLTGIPTAATAPVGTANTQLATTEFVANAVGSAGGGTITGVTAGSGLVGGGTTGTVSLALDTSLALTGIPTAATAAPGTNTVQLATTAFVTNAIASIPAGGGTITGVTAGTSLTGGGTSGNVTVSLDTNVNLTGVPTAATATRRTSTTQLATTQFVMTAVPGTPNNLDTQTSKLYVNLNNAPVIPASGAVVQMSGLDTGVDSNTTLVVDAAGQPILRFRKAMGTIAASSVAGNALPPNNTTLATIDMQAYNNVGPLFFGGGAQIRGQTSQAWTPTGFGTLMQFWTTRNDSVTPQIAMFIGGRGGLVVGAAVDGGPGTVNAQQVIASGENLLDLINALDARISALGG